MPSISARIWAALASANASAGSFPEASSKSFHSWLTFLAYTLMNEEQIEYLKAESAGLLTP